MFPVCPARQLLGLFVGSDLELLQVVALGAAVQAAMIFGEVPYLCICFY